MSWDVIVMRFSEPYASFAEVPEDEKGTPLGIGPREDVHRQVLKVFPGTDWSDPTWGDWDSEFGSVEFGLGKSDPVEAMMLCVRADRRVIPGILALCAEGGWRAYDTWTGEFLDRQEDSEKGLNAWRAYLNQILGKDRQA